MMSCATPMSMSSIFKVALLQGLGLVRATNVTATTTCEDCLQDVVQVQVHMARKLRYQNEAELATNDGLDVAGVVRVNGSEVEQDKAPAACQRPSGFCTHA